MSADTDWWDGYAAAARDAQRLAEWMPPEEIPGALARMAEDWPDADEKGVHGVDTPGGPNSRRCRPWPLRRRPTTP